MASKKQLNNSSYFPHDRVKSLLNSSKVVCVFGYGLSEGYAPHYYDIQSGVWSSSIKSSNIDPFTNNQHYQFVSNWFNWRKVGIKTKANIKALNEVSKLASAFNLTMGTQNVDGLHRYNNLDSIFELYGCVMDEKCIFDGPADNAFEQSVPQISQSSFEIVSNTSYQLFPDVEIFGWNSKALVRAALMKLVIEAKLIIKIGVDEDLAPFNENEYQKKLSDPVLEIHEKGITFSEFGNTYTLNLSQIENKLNNGNPDNKVEIKSMSDVIRSLHEMYI